MSGPSSVLRSVWDAIPSTNCKGWCVESCGPIGAGPEETRLLAERGVLLPDLLAVLESVRAGGEPPTCPALVNGRCTVYEVRPTVCFLPDTYIYSSRGPVQISSILAGDRVFGADGQLHRVEATASRWYQGLIAGVRFTGTHVSAWCTVDHQWLCVSQKDKRKRPVPLWKSAADLQPKRHHQVGDYLCFPRTFEDVCDLEKLDVTKFVSGSLSDDDTTLRPFTVGSFPGRIQQEMPAVLAVDDDFLYLLGMYLAEGSASIQSASFTLAANEGHIAERLSGYLTSLGVTSWSITRRRNTLVLAVTSALFARLMKALGGVLAPTKVINGDLFEMLSHAQRWKIFEAWDEGDGRKCRREKEISVTTVSRQLALQMSLVALGNGLFPRLYAYLPSSRGNLNYDLHLFPSNWRAPKPGYGTRNMVDDSYVYTPSVTPEIRDYAGPVIDIQVEGAQSFVTSSGIAHNCRLWGAVEEMPCPWGCEPVGGRLPSEKGRLLMHMATGSI